MANIFYVNPHNIICGGNKIIFEHCNQLAKKYQKCFIVCDDEVPDWMDVNAYFLDKVTAMQIMQPEDLVIFHWDDDDKFVMKCPAQNKYYLVQNFEHKNDDIFKLPIKFISVSSYIQKHNKEVYGIDSSLVMNGIDMSMFYPRKVKRNSKRIFAIDIGGVKAVEDVKAAEKIVKKERNDLEFVYLNGLTPEQIATEYSKSEIYISASLYEGFGLPVLEAMLCGAAVICTDSKGVDDFAFDGKNCLKIPIKDPKTMANAIIELINDDKKREKFKKEGQKTAKKFTWDETIRNLAKIYNLKNKRSDRDLFKSMKNVRIITSLDNEKKELYGEQIIHKNSKITLLGKINGGKRLLSWISKLGFPFRYKVGKFDYNKINVVKKIADIEVQNQKDGSLICYVPKFK
jgi:L-malate glycosyltransferase